MTHIIGFECPGCRVLYEAEWGTRPKCSNQECYYGKGQTSGAIPPFSLYALSEQGFIREAQSAGGAKSCSQSK